MVILQTKKPTGPEITEYKMKRADFRQVEKVKVQTKAKPKLN